MGTEVLRPQDCLAERFSLPSPAAGFHGRRHYLSYGYAKVSRRPGPARTEQKKRPNHHHHRQQQQHHHNYQQQEQEPTVNSKRSSGVYDHAKSQIRAGNGNGSTPRAVTILRRGQSLDSLTSKINGNEKSNKTTSSSDGEVLALETNYGLDRLGRERQMPLARPVDVYAGSGFTASSPSPSSLPLPSFFKRPESNSFDDSATRDLRRLLRLE